MPRWVVTALVLLGCLALVPVACVARARTTRADLTRLHLVSDMDNQGRFKTQQAHPEFADGRAMRVPVAGTVAQGHWIGDDHFERGTVGADYAASLPVPVTAELLARGRERFDIYCAPCHGLAGYGDGMVGRRAEARQQGTWVPPASFHAEPTSSRPVGHLFNTITNGIRNMPAYGSQVPTHDRWAIVAYVKTLQRSQHARLEDVPPALRDGLR